jgi:hypothetical protein
LTGSDHSETADGGEAEGRSEYHIHY